VRNGLGPDKFFGECLRSVATISCPAGCTATLPVMISRTQLAPIELVVRITQKSVVQIQSATTAAGGKNGLSATRKLIAEPRFLWIISSPAPSRGPETGLWEAENEVLDVCSATRKLSHRLRLLL